MKIVYIAGPYKADTREGVEANIRSAEAAAIDLWNHGLGVFCPHLNSAHFDRKTSADPRFFLEFDMRMLQVCDVMLLLPNWGSSAGTAREIQEAEKLGVPIYHSLKHLLSSE